MQRTLASAAVRWARAVVLLLAATACGRRPPATTAPVARPADTVVTPALARTRTVTLPLGEDNVTVSGRSDERVEVAVTGAHAMTLVFALPSVDEFLAAATRLATRPRQRRERPNLTRAMIDEVGGDGGALSLSRRVHGRVLTYRLFFADNVGGGFRITVSPAEARAVLQAMREAAAAVRPAPPATATARRRSTRRAATAKATPNSTAPKTTPQPAAPKSTPKTTTPQATPRPTPKATPKSIPKTVPDSTPKRNP